jgi:hypothetical protein
MKRENIMKRKLTWLLILCCLLTAGSINSIAQEKKPAKVDLKVPPDGTFKVLMPKIAIGKVVKGAPYSATATTETIQTLSDGNQIIRKNQSKLYRDSEGRNRIEQTLETIGKWTSDGEAQQSIFINDPVAGVSYNLDPQSLSAQRNVYAPKKVIAEPQNGNFTVNGKPISQGEFEALMEKKKRTQEEMPAMPIKEALTDLDLKKIAMLKAMKTDSDQRKTESLGTQTIEGVTAEGTRSTLTIPAGEIGNTLPIEIVDETWYSPELQINVMTRHRDPRSGETTYRLTNINRGEPDRSLFELPANYTLLENKFPVKPKPIKEEQ